MSSPGEIPGRGKIVGWRTVKQGSGYRRVALVSKAGPRGGETVMSPVAHDPGGSYSQHPTTPTHLARIRSRPKIRKVIKNPGALTTEVRLATGDPTALPQDHLPLIRKWAQQRHGGKLTRRALRARFYLYKVQDSRRVNWTP